LTLGLPLCCIFLLKNKKSEMQKKKKSKSLALEMDEAERTLAHLATCYEKSK